jgi:hypothetical protein
LLTWIKDNVPSETLDTSELDNLWKILLDKMDLFGGLEKL